MVAEIQSSSYIFLKKRENNQISVRFASHRMEPN